MKRALIAASVLWTASARAEEPVSLTVSGSSAPGFSTAAKEGDRPRDTADAAAVLQGLPGLRVRRLGGENGFATLSIRGAASNQVAVTLAGVPLTGASDPSLDLSTLPLWPGATLRVHRTFAPASLGGGYLGGIVDVAPVDLTTSRTEAYNAYGSFGTYRLRLASVQRLGDWRIGAGVAFHRTEGDFTYFDPFRGVDGEDRARRNNASRQLAGMVHARHDGDRWTWLITSLLSARSDGIAGPFDNPSFGTHMRRNRALLAIETRRRDDDGRFLARIWARRDGFEFFDPLREQSRIGESRYHVLATGLTLARSVTSEHWTLDPRIEGGVEARDAYQRTRSGILVDTTYRHAATSVVLAARGDVWRDTGHRASLMPVAHLGLEHLFGDNVTLGAHVGTLARPPSFLELLGDGGIYSAAPTLRSERSYAADLGFRFRGAENKVRWEAELVGFAWEVRDLIVVMPVSALTLRAFNIGAARIAGGELSVAATTGPVRAAASYTRLYTENRSDVASDRGAPLPGRPDHDLTLDVSVRAGPVTLRYGFDLISPTTLDAAGTRVLPTRIFHGAGVRLDARRVSVIAEVQNMFDRRSVDVVYETGSAFRYPVSDFLGYPLAGRRFSIAVRANL
jgi:vitamin B12 transporter